LVELFPAAHFLPAVDDAAEQLGGFFRVVAGRVGFTSIEVDAGRLTGLGQYGLPVGEAGEGRRIEAGEGVEGIALDIAPGNRRVEKAQVEAAVVPDQNGALAACGFHRLAYATGDVAHRLGFRDGHAQRVVQLDAGELQRGGFDIEIG